MAQCPHCQNSRWAIVAGANVCSNCGRAYEPPLARASINGGSHRDEVMAPIALAAYDAQTESHRPPSPRVAEQEEPRVLTVPE
jgi:hypothetical protein